jgi:hypothetical protein
MRQATGRMSGKPIGNALLTTAQLAQLADGNMVARARPAPLPTAPSEWVVTIASRGTDGRIEKLRVRSVSGEEVPDYVGPKDVTAPPKAWTAKVSKRDEAGLIRELHITPSRTEEK